VLFSGDFAAGTGQIELLSDYVFTLTSPVAQNADFAVIFDEAVAALDGGGSTVQSTPATPLKLGIGGGNYTAPFNFVDNLGTSIGALTAKDSYLYFSSPAAIASGETITLQAGIYTFGAGTGFNPEFASKTFSGNLFLTDGNAAQISGNVSAVPEPRDFALLTGIGLAGFAVWRRRTAAVKATRDEMAA
jgi:hypothetical protein